MRPAVAFLRVQIPVSLGDGLRVHELVGFDGSDRRIAAARADAFAHELGVDARVDDEMGDVDVLRPQFARHALRDGPKAEFRRGEGGVADAAAQGGSGAGEKDSALPARQHQARRLAAREKAGIAGHLPHLAEDALGGVEQRKVHVGAGVEDADLQRRVRIGFGEEGGDVFLLAGVQRAGLAAAATFLNRGFKLGELVGGAATGEDGVALGGEAPGDRRSDVVAGADHGGGGIAGLHEDAPSQVKTIKS